MIDAESVFLPVGAQGDRLHVRRLRPVGRVEAPPVLLVHGAVENGRIFYSASGRGLAPFLARAGFDCHVADLRGRGLSTPAVHPGSTFGQTEAITEDVPALVRHVRALAGERPQHWIAHSWGGVLLFSCLARFPELLPRVASITCFGTKRSISVDGLAKRFFIDLMWNRVGPFMARRYGYLPAVRFKLGADNESRLSHEHCVRWVDPRGAWVDPTDGFDYGAAIRKLALPPTLHLAGVADSYLGHPSDVRRFAAECGTPRESVRVLSRAAGNRVDYGHVNILTHREAEGDHFADVARWLAHARST